MKTLIVAFFAFYGASTFAQTQFKHDIGVRFSSDDEERLQLQYRWHKSDKWAFGVTASYGQYGNGNYSLQLEDGDTTYIANSYYYDFQHYSLMVDVVRKLSFMKHNFYYVGASIGGGAIQRNYNSYWARYEAAGDASSSLFPNVGEEIESERYYDHGGGVSGRARLYVGADVPILDRLTFNLEVGTGLAIARYDSSFSGYSYWSGSVTGGLRYRFGKAESLNK